MIADQAWDFAIEQRKSDVVLFRRGFLFRDNFGRIPLSRCSQSTRSGSGCERRSEKDFQKLGTFCPIALTVEALRELRDERETQIAALREENQALRERLEAIESLLQSQMADQ